MVLGAWPGPVVEEGARREDLGPWAMRAAFSFLLLWEKRVCKAETPKWLGWQDAAERQQAPGLTGGSQKKVDGKRTSMAWWSTPDGDVSASQGSCDPDPGCSGTSRQGLRALTWPHAAISPLL